MVRCKPGARMHRHYKPRIGTFILSLILGLLAFLPVSHAQPLTVDVDKANPPFMYRSHERAVGIYPDIVRAISARAGLNVEIVPVPWRVHCFISIMAMVLSPEYTKTLNVRRNMRLAILSTAKI